MSEDNTIRSYDEFRADPFFDVPTVETKTSVSKVDLPMLFNNTRVRQLNYFIDPPQG